MITKHYVTVFTGYTTELAAWLDELTSDGAEIVSVSRDQSRDFLVVYSRTYATGYIPGDPSATAHMALFN